MTVRDQSEIDEAVFAHIKDAAAKGDRAPSILNMSKAIHVRRDAVRIAQERLVEAGRLVDRGAYKAPAWFIPETGRETARVLAGRPPISGRDMKDGNGLTVGQREVLSIARQLARQGMEISAANIADRGGLTREGTLSRLTRIAGNGFLRPLAPGRFALVDVEKRKREAPQPVTTIRPDGVRLTVYPPMIASPLIDTVTSMAIEGRWSESKTARVVSLARYAEARAEPLRALCKREPRRVWMRELNRQVTI